MALGRHKRTSKGRFRKEKRSTKIENLKETYPVLKGINGNMHVGTLLDRLGADSLNQALKKLRTLK
jgi:hypothetical protein